MRERCLNFIKSNQTFGIELDTHGYDYEKNTYALGISLAKVIDCCYKPIVHSSELQQLSSLLTESLCGIFVA